MDFNLNEEQQLLADAVNRWLVSEYPADSRRKLAMTEAGFSEPNWQQLAELGVLGVSVPKEHGGLGAGPIETAIVMQAFGRALLLEPYLPTAVMAVEALECGGSPAQRALFLPAIVSGKVRFAVAALEPDARFELGRVGTTATRAAEGYIVSGRKAVVIQGAAAHQLLVTAEVPDSGVSKGGLALFMVDAAAKGVRTQSFPTMDGLRAAEITFDRVLVDANAMLGRAGDGLALIERIIDRGLAALCAESVGAMERLVELTTDHLRSRRQFGQALANFQALQHRVAEMMIATEQARSMALMAAAQVSNSDARARRRALAAAKALIGQSGRYVGEQAVQLHGGMGMTDELEIGRYFKRLVCIDMSFGDTNHHLERFGELL